ncbi:MAG: BlaI/MecI/CopY family transcriptional regulator, partial [Phycisphaerales bacterium]|nr:BlaI/MecI/CopY family transcriptional regulator [Phycisphaerales bacterium]
LGAAELEVLKVLWDDGPGTVRDILQRLNDRGRDLAYTTVQTFLTRLEQKGVVKADKSEFAFRYSPRVSREKISRSRLQRLVDQLYDGAAGPLVLQLLQNSRLTPNEIDQLQKLIEKLDSGREAPDDEPR